MSQGDALLAAVRADPDDDLPRLVYADWFEENGEPLRAAFIRSQIDYARAEPFSPAARAARERFVPLEARYGPVWAGEPYLYANAHPIHFRFERGFVGHVSVDVLTLSHRYEAILDTQPVQSLELIRFLSVQTGSGSASELLWLDTEPVYRLPHLRRLRRLAYARGSDLFDVDYRAWRESENLAGLRDLAVPGCLVQPWCLAELLESEALPHLEGLDLTDVTHVGPQLVTSLARSPHRRLRRLNLTGVFLTSELLRQLLRSPALHEVEELRLGRAPGAADPGPLFYLNLGWVLPWRRLKVLDLSGQVVGDELLRGIARCRDAVGLRAWGLAHTGLNAESAEVLIDSPYLNLYHLDVRGNRLDTGTLARLRQRYPDAEIIA